MEDINFKKFICYILNCIGATENNKITVFYVDKDLKKINYDTNNSQIAFDELKYTYVTGAIGADNLHATDDADILALYAILIDNTSNIKQYFNIKQVPSYITIKSNKKQLDVSQSIHQAFNLIKMFFDAKKWYFNQYTNNQNQMSYSSINFRSDKKMFGGFEIKYKNGDKEVDDSTSYDKFLANVLRDFIYMVSGQTNQIKNFDVITLYVLSKINYYLAKKYAILSINNKPEDFYDTLNKYNQIVAYDNSFFDNFTYYKNVTDKDITNYPRYYQKEILELLKAGKSTEEEDDYKSFFMVIKKTEITNSKMSVTEIMQYLFYITTYKMLYQNNTEYVKYFDSFNTFCINLNKLIQKIKEDVNNKTLTTGQDVRKAAQNAVDSDTEFKTIIVHDDTADDVFKKQCEADGDDAKFTESNRQKINDNINKIIVDIASHQSNLNNIIKFINENNISCIFKALKSYIKKNSNNTFSSLYQSPTISYSLTPMNIRPLIAKRATETDLSNYAAQIASDSFLNSNKLPALPEVTTLGAPGLIGLMEGGSTNINNSSNVYRTIFNSILKTLNSKKIRLNESDRKKVDDNLNELERTEQYLKSTLSDYAKYASATEDRRKIISYEEVHKFVNEYENKLREYNKNSAHMLKFIGKLTRYLVIK